MTKGDYTGSAAADGAHDFHCVAGLQDVVGVLGTGYDFPVHFHGDALADEAEVLHQIGRGDAIGHFLDFAIDGDFHAHSVAIRPAFRQSRPLAPGPALWVISQVRQPDDATSTPMDNPSFIPANVAGTLDGLFRERVRLSPDRTAYRHFRRDTKQWQPLSWAEMGARVSRWQQALAREDLDPGDRVAILHSNGPEWVAFEQAALGLGLVVVPLYTDDRPDNIAYILDDSGSRVLFVQTDKQLRALDPHREELTTVQRYVVAEAKHPERLAEDPDAVLAADWVSDAPGLLHERGGDPNALATIVYTSGTTGKPKGVMLSHRNILANAEAAIHALGIDDTHELLSFLPISHTFERTCGYYVPMMCGATVSYARSIQQLADDLQHIRPTALISVPRIFERIHDKLQMQLRKDSAVRRRLFNLAAEVGWRRFEVQQGRARPGPSLLLWPVLRKLVASRVQTRLGGRLRFAVSGGAALPPPVAKIFIGLGIPVIQGYGMTETSPVLSANRLDRNLPKSVGLPLPGIELRTDENEELLARGPNVMLGYWNNHRATSEMIDPDGWLHTGDKARIDEQGFVHITGRIKDIVVMSNGEKVPPADMEMAITLDPLFEQALIIGEGRPYLTALVVLNGEEWFPLATEHGLDPFEESSLQDRNLQTTLLKRIGEALHDFPGYARIRRVTPLLQPWTIENGLLTPTLKVKRAKVVEAHGENIENMYN